MNLYGNEDLLPEKARPHQSTEWPWVMGDTTKARDWKAEEKLYPSSTKKNAKYIILGGGPGGIQLAAFLEQKGRDYLVLERNRIPGSFYIDIPRHRKLISINKPYTIKGNPEYNLRFDWHSLLNEDRPNSNWNATDVGSLYRGYSNDYFPNADTLVKYLGDFALHHKVQIRYDSHIKVINKGNGGKGYKLTDFDGQEYNCEHLVIATGISKTVKLPLDGAEHVTDYTTMSVDPNYYRNKSIVVMGKGNSALETADFVSATAKTTHVLGRSPHTFAWTTHYAPNLRAVNNNFLDTVQLQLNNVMAEVNLDAKENAFIKDPATGKIILMSAADAKRYRAGTPLKELQNGGRGLFNEPYDEILSCLGWRFDNDILGDDLKIQMHPNGRYPKLTNAYESVSHPGLYFAGTLQHSRDFRKSSGGVLDGFRYLVRAVHHQMESNIEKITFPAKIIQGFHPKGDALAAAEAVMRPLFKRVNEFSGPFLMFSFIVDVAILHDGHIEYLEDFPYDWLGEYLKERYDGKPVRFYVMDLEFGKCNGFKNGLVESDPFEAGAYAYFPIHPIFRYYELEDGARYNKTQWHGIHHVIEDQMNRYYDKTEHIKPLRKWLELTVGGVPKDKRPMNWQLQWMHQDEAPNCRTFITWMHLKNAEVGLKKSDYKWLQDQIQKVIKFKKQHPSKTAAAAHRHTLAL